MSVDPFTQVYNAIESVFVADGYKLVSWNSGRNPEPEIPTDEELPEFQIRPTDLSGRIGSSSCGSEVFRGYQVLINSGDRRLSIMFGLEWRLLKTLYKLKYGALDSLDFVDSVDIRSAASGLSNAIENRGIEGWTALWTIEVSMLFSGEDLI